MWGVVGANLAPEDAAKLKQVAQRIKLEVNIPIDILLDCRPPKLRSWDDVEQNLRQIAEAGVGDAATVQTWCDRLHMSGVIPELTDTVREKLRQYMDESDSQLDWWQRPLNESHHSDGEVAWSDFAGSHEFDEEEIAHGCGPTDELTLRNIIYAVWACSVAELIDGCPPVRIGTVPLVRAGGA